MTNLLLIMISDSRGRIPENSCPLAVFNVMLGQREHTLKLNVRKKKPFAYVHMIRRNSS